MSFLFELPSALQASLNPGLAASLCVLVMLGMPSSGARNLSPSMSAGTPCICHEFADRFVLLFCMRHHWLMPC